MPKPVINMISHISVFQQFFIQREADIGGCKTLRSNLIKPRRIFYIAFHKARSTISDNSETVLLPLSRISSSPSLNKIQVG